MNLCITINLKNKFQKYNNLHINYYIQSRLEEINYFDIKTEVKVKKIKNIIIEYRCINNPKQFQTFLKCIGSIKVIIVGFGKPEINLGNRKVYYVNLKDKKHILKIISLCSDKKKEHSDKAFKYENKQNLGRAKKCNTINQGYKNNYKNPGNLNEVYLKKEANLSNVILGISLDRKVYATTYLVILSIYLNEKNKKEIEFLEKEQSLIDVEDFIQLNKNNIKYKKFSIIDNGLFHTQNLQIIDVGLIQDIKIIRSFLKYKYKKIIVFTTDCLKVVENNRYIRIYRLLEKHNNIIFINRKDIFDRKIQEKSTNYKSKKIKKNIKKNKIIKELSV